MGLKKAIVRESTTKNEKQMLDQFPSKSSEKRLLPVRTCVEAGSIPVVRRRSNVEISRL